MARNGITYSQVELAAEKILNDGYNPTIEKIRQVLGGTGSNSTIAKHLNDWKTQRLAATRHDLTSLQVAPDPVNAAVNHVWQQIREESSKEIAAIKEQFHQEMTVMQTELVSLQTECESLITTKKDLQTQLNAVTGEKELLKIDLRQSQQEIALLNESKQRLQDQLEQLKVESTTTLTELKKIQERELESAKNEMHSLRREYANTISEIKLLQENERHRYMEILDQTKTAQLKEIENNKLLLTKLATCESNLTSTQLLYEKTHQDLESALQRENTLILSISEIINNQQQINAITQAYQDDKNKLCNLEEVFLKETAKQQAHIKKIEAEVVTKLTELNQTWMKTLCEKIA